jgi:3-hydroxybutyrate dehydrogenase
VYEAPVTIPAYLLANHARSNLRLQALATSGAAVLTDVLLAHSAVQRLIEPDEVAAAVAYLCGPASGSVTRSSLVLDGGWTAS